MLENIKVALIVPCLNEELTVGTVLSDFKSQFSNIELFVVDNGSSDATATIAMRHGAKVIYEARKGKGNAIRRAFALVDADVFILVDGDDTYDVSNAHVMVAKLIEEDLDMVVGVRMHKSGDAYRGGHEFGNLVFNKLFEVLFGNQFSDIFSGYRVFSRSFVKSFPALSLGFETETEMSVHAANLQLATGELEVAYSARPAGSNSKLNTYKDGFRILITMLNLFRVNKPLLCFSSLSLLPAICSASLMYPILSTFLETGLVPKFPSLIVAVGCIVVSFLLVMVGTMLQTILSFQAENRRLAYLATRNSTN